MASIQTLQHIHGLSASYFSDYYPVRPHSKSRFDQITNCYRYSPCHIRHLCFQTHKIVNSSDLKFRIIFNCDQSFIFRDIFRNSTKKGCFSAACTTTDHNGISGLHQFFQKLCTFLCNTTQRNQLFHSYRIVRKTPDRQDRTI